MRPPEPALPDNGGAREREEPTEPKSLADPAALQRRRTLLDQPHVVALRPFLGALRSRHGEAPDPDPLDGGAEARLLLLLETPGPRIRRTGFVSRDNPAETSANLFRALRDADLARRDTLIWNAVPWVIHPAGARNRAPTRQEIAAGLDQLGPLLERLPRLGAAVLAGRVAGAAGPILNRLRPDLAILRMPHPSPTFLCTSPAHPAKVAETLRGAAALLRETQRKPPPTLPCRGRVGPEVRGGVRGAAASGWASGFDPHGSAHPARFAVDPPPPGEGERPLRRSSAAQAA